MSVRDATEIIEIDRTRRCAAHRGTRQMYPHSAQVRAYSRGCHGNRMLIIFHGDGESNASRGGNGLCCRVAPGVQGQATLGSLADLAPPPVHGQPRMGSHPYRMMTIAGRGMTVGLVVDAVAAA